MNFNRHFKLENAHAPFSASTPTWLNYDVDKAIAVFNNKKAAEMGTKMHAWAKQTIDLGIKQPKSKKTLYQYVNDAIGFRMDTEVVLFYSQYFFGTADAISFIGNVLRIHDLKTGVGKVKMEQLMVYAALFCLEYNIAPNSIKEIELRIYQNDEVLFHNPSYEEVDEVINKIKELDTMLQSLLRGGLEEDVNRDRFGKTNTR